MTDTRTPEQAARAAPVSLPAGSFDSAELQKSLDEAAKSKNDSSRDELVAAALDKHNETRIAGPAAAEEAAPAEPAPINAAPADGASKGE